MKISTSVMSPKIIPNFLREFYRKVMFVFHHLPYLSTYRRVPTLKSNAPIIGQFCPRKYRRFRRKIRMKRRRPLCPIEECSINEYLEGQRGKNKFNVSASDQMLHRLRKGWTLNETFGVTPKPRIEPQVVKNHRLIDAFSGTKFKRRRCRRPVDYDSLMTEVLTDVQIMKLRRGNLIRCR